MAGGFVGYYCSSCFFSFSSCRTYKVLDQLNYVNKLSAVQDYIKANEGNSSSGDETEAMAHVGNGFYLYKMLYDNIYAHQREGVLFLWKLHKEKRGGVLGDDMG